MDNINVEEAFMAAILPAVHKMNSTTVGTQIETESSTIGSADSSGGSATRSNMVINPWRGKNY